MSGFVTGILEGLGQDYLIDKANEYAEEHFQPVKDPFYEKLPNGKQIKRRLPDYCTKQESKAWKHLQNQAWSHDKSCCGCCCWTDGIGWAPFLAIFPVIGPALMYWVHSKLIDYADKQYKLPPDLLVKMHGNIGVDLAISLVPILGILFSWMHASSTRNCAMVYNFIVERNLEKITREKNTREQREREAAMREQQRREQNRIKQRNEEARVQQQNAVNQQREQEMQMRQLSLEQQRRENRPTPTNYAPPANVYPAPEYFNGYNPQMRPPPPAHAMSNSRAQRPYI